MSVVVTVSNELNLRKLKDFLGAKDESEAVEIIIEKSVRDFEKQSKTADLPKIFLKNYLPKKRIYQMARAFRRSLMSVKKMILMRLCLNGFRRKKVLR